MSDHDELMQRCLSTLGDMAAAGARHAPGPWMLALTSFATLFKSLELKMRNEGLSFDELLAILRVPLRDDTFLVDTAQHRRPR